MLYEVITNPLLAKFLYINETLRQQNVETVLKVPSDTRAELMWEGRFSRLPGAANRAQFADKRTYKYNVITSYSIHYTKLYDLPDSRTMKFSDLLAT